MSKADTVLQFDEAKEFTVTLSEADMYLVLGAVAGIAHGKDTKGVGGMEKSADKLKKINLNLMKQVQKQVKK